MTTKQVAELLGIKPQALMTALWNNRISAPEKTPSGRYDWKPEDIQKASWALFHRAYSPPLEDLAAAYLIKASAQILQEKNEQLKIIDALPNTDIKD